MPRPPEVGPNLPLPKPVNTNPVAPTTPDTAPNIERPIVPPGPSPFRQDFSPDDRDALNRDAERPTDAERPIDDIERTPGLEPRRSRCAQPRRRASDHTRASRRRHRATPGLEPRRPGCRQPPDRGPRPPLGPPDDPGAHGPRHRILPRRPGRRAGRRAPRRSCCRARVGPGPERERLLRPGLGRDDRFRAHRYPACRGRARPEGPRPRGPFTASPATGSA